ncbi:peptidase M24 [bacterium]|nr:peptidase M24 [bacterium]|tara:strand:- start:92 stop:1204 length:1113 start_codon:yes stop_codon:yes gene_type:complete
MIRLLYGSTKDSDVQYIVQQELHIPTFLIDRGDTKQLFLDSREYGVIADGNKDKTLELIKLEPFIEQARKVTAVSSTAALAEVLFTEFKLMDEEVVVGNALPLDVADHLRAKGATLLPTADLYPERQQKTAAELDFMRSAMVRTQKAFTYIEQVLRDSTIDGAKIMYQGNVLTSEFLKWEVQLLLLREGLSLDDGLVISSASQASMPHHSGEGELKANETIICDIFPRDRATGYWADMTRTYVKGTPSSEARQMYETVIAAQEAVFGVIKPGVTPDEIHAATLGTFEAAGYDFSQDWITHRTGHSIGLDIHEAPSIETGVDTPLKEGHVFTVEPGLYHPEYGGVRIEDIVVVTGHGYENLTNYEKTLVST